MHYDQLIARAKNRLLEGYCERHHIVPKCMSGSDDAENIAVLTAREHYVAHLLLIQIHKNTKYYSKLICAAKMMTIGGSRHRDRSKNRWYSWLRERHSSAMSEIMQGNTNGRGLKGRQITWADKISKALKGRKQPPRRKSHRRSLSMSAIGNTHGKGHSVTEEHRDNIRKANSRPVVIDGIVYASRLSASKAYDVLPETILCWIRAGKAADAS